ncbi:unnamed protein product [Boreogadus saida]
MQWRREQGDKLGADAVQREQGGKLGADELGADAVQKMGADGKAPPGIMERGSRGLPNISTPVTNKREGEMLIWEGVSQCPNGGVLRDEYGSIRLRPDHGHFWRWKRDPCRTFAD